MTRRTIAGPWVLLAAAALGCAPVATNRVEEPQADAGELDVKGLFHPPQAVCDQDGKPIRTRRAVGHPVVFDWNGDGRNDIVLGCHLNMNTASGEILVLENVGDAEQPRFRWPGISALRLEEGSKRTRISCGCKSGGTPEVHVTDWNGDGYFDLVVDTYWKDGVRLFLNTGRSRTSPTFIRAEMLHPIGSHGKGSGGGDWTGDGVMDFVFPVNAYGWAVYPGTPGPKGGVRFASKPALLSREFKIVGQQRWFARTPYAWNFSGKNPPGSDIAEIVAVVPDPDTAGKPYCQKRCHIRYYWLNRRRKVCTLKGTLATNRAAMTRLGIGDLNGDGCMDLLYTGGVFTRGDETMIHVLYGKVPNMPAQPRAAAASSNAADKR